MTSAKEGLLEEWIIIVLSLATLPGLVLQVLVNLPANIALAFDTFDLAVVFVFAADYAVRFRRAPSKRDFVVSVWSLLDLAIILFVAAGFIFTLPLLYSAPLLRTLRVARLVTESGRSSEETSTFEAPHELMKSMNF